MRRRWLVAVAIAAAVVAWVYFEAARHGEPGPLRVMERMPPVEEGKEFDPHSVLTAPRAAPEAPDIGLRGRHGVLRLSEQRGRVVLVSFWATWCVACHMSVPMIDRLYESEKANGFAVMGVALEEAALSRIEDFARGMGISYPVGFAERAEQVRHYPAESLPTMVLVDRAGRVRLILAGYDPELEERLPKMVQALLSESG